MGDKEQEKKQEMGQEPEEAGGLSRREFLRDAGLAVAGTAAGAALVACSATPTAAPTKAPAAASPAAPPTTAPVAAQQPQAAVVEPAFEPEETRCLTFGT